jgi:AAA ATPase domain
VEEAILGQRREVLDRIQSPATGPSETPATGPSAAPATRPAGTPATRPASTTPEDLFVGRGDELRAIAGAAAAAARRSGGVILVTGEGGAGKSSLLGQATAQLAAAGWTVVTGSCPDAGEAPSAWAWTEALRALAERIPPAEPAGILGPLLDPDAHPAAQTPAPETKAVPTSPAGTAPESRAVPTSGIYTERPVVPAPVPAGAGAMATRFRLHRAVVAWLRDYAIQAAERADRCYAYDVAVSLLEQALDASARAPGAENERAEQQADLLGRLLRAQIRAGRIAAARATRQRAADAAAAAARDDLVTAAFAAWTEPTPWQTRPYGVVDERAVAILERQLERDGLDPVTRCRLLAALVAELAGEDDPRPARAAAEDDPRPARAAAEAEAIARRLGAPDLLALALTAGTAAAVLGRPGELRRRLDTGRRLADEYRLG